MVNKEDISTHVAARGMLQLASKDFISSLAGIIFFVLIARFLPNVNDLGTLVGLQTISFMFVLIAGIGLPFAATRFISTYVGSNQKTRADGLYPILFTVGVLLSAAFSAALFVFAPQLSEVLFHDINTTELVQLIALDVFFLTVGAFSISLLDASMEFRKIARISIAVTLIKYSLSFIFFAGGLGLIGIVLGLVIADGIGVAVFVLSLSSKIFGPRLSVSLFAELRPILRFALSLYGYVLCSVLLLRVDVYLLMILSTLYFVGLYGPAVFVGMSLFILLASLDQALVPFTARIYGKHGTIYYKHLSTQASRFLLLFFFPLSFAVAASSPTLITMVMGERYAESAYPTSIIVIAITLLSPGVIVNNLLRSAGYTKPALKATSAALAFQVIISLVMIPQYGIAGAATAKLMAVFVFVVPLLYSLYRIGGLDFDRNAFKFGLIGSGIITIEVIAIGMVLSGPLSLVLQYVTAIVSYMIVLNVTHVLIRKDVELIDKIFAGKINWLTVPLAKLLIRKS